MTVEAILWRYGILWGMAALLCVILVHISFKYVALTDYPVPTIRVKTVNGLLCVPSIMTFAKHS